MEYTKTTNINNTSKLTIEIRISQKGNTLFICNVAQHQRELQLLGVLPRDERYLAPVQLAGQLQRRVPVHQVPPQLQRRRRIGRFQQERLRLVEVAHVRRDRSRHQVPVFHVSVGVCINFYSIIY